MNRIAIHPYMTMFSGTNTFLKQSGVMSNKEMDLLRSHMEIAESLFSYDDRFLSLVRELRQRTEKS
jgi:hypothetical protein